jgi:hypothetical protein
MERYRFNKTRGGTMTHTPAIPQVWVCGSDEELDGATEKTANLN